MFERGGSGGVDFIMGDMVLAVGSTGVLFFFFKQKTAYEI